MRRDKRTISTTFKRVTIGVAAGFALLVLVFVVGMNIKDTAEQQTILEHSIESQLISISLAAREMLDVEALESYNSQADVDADKEAYNQVLIKLRLLQTNVGAEYIYVLRYIDGEYLFVFDTDTENEEIFVPYELSPVHEQAFAGHNSADVLNVTDEWGSYNTAAVPIWQNGRVVGIVSTDIRDTYLRESQQVATRNAVILIVTLVIALGAMMIVIVRLLGRVRKMQEELSRLAHFDTITGLPNRQYLLEYLQDITSAHKKGPFALLFIDLDNFKQVNDNAGHDAGDELLRHIAQYLETAVSDSLAFRPSPGILNIAARIGGDEFVQVVSGIETEQQAAEVAEKLLNGFGGAGVDKFIEMYQVGLSIGVALYPNHTDNYHVLIKYADIAMYHAKHAGKNSYRIYDYNMKSKEEK